MFGMTKSRITEQRANRRQPRIAGAHTVLSVALQMVKEGTDQWRIEIVDVEFGWHLTVSFRSEDQEQPQCVAIRLKSVRTDLALADEPITEEHL